MKRLLILLFVVVLLLSAVVDAKKKKSSKPKYTPNTCLVWGDPHFVTFDAVKYDYQNRASWNYLVVNTNLVILAHFYACVPEAKEKTKKTIHDTDVTCVDIIQVHSRNGDGSVTSVEISINENKQGSGFGKTVNGHSWYNYVKGPGGRYEELSPTTKRRSASRSVGSVAIAMSYPKGGTLKYTTRAQGTRIVYTKRTVVVYPGDALKKRSCGLCGTWSKTKKDDFWSAHGKKYAPKQKNAGPFAKTWEFEGGALRWDCPRGPTKKPTKRPTQKPTRKPTKRPTVPPTRPPTRPPPPTKPPTTPPTPPPTRPPTTPPTATTPPTIPPTGVPTPTPTTPPTTPPTEPPTTPPTDVPTEPPTQPPTDEPTEPPTEVPTSGSATTGWSTTGESEDIPSTTGSTSTTGEQYSDDLNVTFSDGEIVDDDYVDFAGENDTVILPNITLNTTSVGFNETIWEALVTDYNNTEVWIEADDACTNVGNGNDPDDQDDDYTDYQQCMYDVIGTGTTDVAIDQLAALVISCELERGEDGEIPGSCANGTLLACPDACSAHGVCVNGMCQCNERYIGESCDEKILLTEAEKAGVIAAGAVAGIALGAAAFLLLSGFGAKKGYDYLKNANQKMTNLQTNPLYKESAAGGTNPFYDNKV